MGYGKLRGIHNLFHDAELILKWGKKRVSFDRALHKREV